MGLRAIVCAAAIAVAVPACSDKSDKADTSKADPGDKPTARGGRTDATASKSSGAEDAGAKTSDPKLTASIPVFAKPNSVQLFAQIDTGYNKPPKAFAATVQMKSAYVGWYGDKLFLVLAKRADSCDMFKPVRKGGPRFNNRVKVSLALAGLGPEQQAGAKPVEGVINVDDSVILANGFNRMVFRVQHNGLRFDSGRIKAGETVAGSFYVHQKDDADRNYKGAWMKGSFKATVCRKN